MVEKEGERGSLLDFNLLLKSRVSVNASKNWMQCIAIFISEHSGQCINESAWIWISEPFNVVFLIDFTILLHVMEDVHKRGYQTQVIKTLVMKGLMPLGSTDQTSSLSEQAQSINLFTKWVWWCIDSRGFCYEAQSWFQTSECAAKRVH